MKAIMYHYVREVPSRLPYFRYLHVEDFARQLDWFDENHRFVTRDEFDDACRTGDAPDGVVLTFDDGLVRDLWVLGDIYGLISRLKGAP